MKKTYLLTPGPTPIPERVQVAMAMPLIHHRTPGFEVLFARVQDGLKKLFQTQNTVLTLATTGTGAMDAAICNTFKKGDEVITVNAGKFGERWTKISKAYGLIPHEIFVARGASVTLEQIQEVHRQNPKSVAVLFQASETSTGAVMPTQEIAQYCGQNGMLSVCDAITACGVFNLPMDQWGIDILITGSQKALMIPPGLAFIALSAKARTRGESCDLPHFYFDLKKELKAQLKNQTAWSPATSLIVGLDTSLQMIHQEGLPAMFARHAVLAQATRAGIKALGLSPLALTHPSDAVTAVQVPAQITQGKLIPKLMRDKYGVTIAGGQDELEGQIFRLSHFGYCGPFDVTTAMSALELVLTELGYKFKMGAGVGAALEVFSKKLNQGEQNG